MENIIFRIKRFSNKKIVKYSLPFITFVVMSSLGLREFTKLRYQFSTQKSVTPEQAASYGIEMKDPKNVTLESEYEKIVNLDIDNWNNKRIARPYEE